MFFYNTHQQEQAFPRGGKGLPYPSTPATLSVTRRWLVPPSSKRKACGRKLFSPATLSVNTCGVATFLKEEGLPCFREINSKSGASLFIISNNFPHIRYQRTVSKREPPHEPSLCQIYDRLKATAFSSNFCRTSKFIFTCFNFTHPKLYSTKRFACETQG